MLDEKVVNGFYITTYITNKKEPISGMRFKPYFDAADILKGRKCWTDGEIVSRSILYVSFHEDKVIYHCKDGAFDEDGFGDFAFQTLDAAKIILGM